MATADKIEEAYKTIHDAEKKLLTDTREDLVTLRDAFRARKLPKLLEKVPQPRGMRSAAHGLVLGFDNTIAGWPSYLDGQITQIDMMLKSFEDMDGANANAVAPLPTS